MTTNRLIKILLKLPKSIKELNLSNNPQAGAEAWRVLAEEVLEQTSYRIEKLLLEGCRISDSILKPLAKVIEYNPTLKFLDISRNLIGEPGAVDLAKMLAGNNTLLVLFLHWNKLLPKGGAALARALAKNNTLQILDLSYCSMGGSRENMVKVIQAEMKIQMAAINKIKMSKNGMDPEKMEKDLEAYLAQLELDKAKAPSQSPRQAIPINPANAEAWKEAFIAN